MKKIIGFILSVMMIFSCVAIVNAKDFDFESGKQVAYVVGEVGAAVEGKYTVPIYLYWSEDYTGNVATGAFQLKYDTEKLTYVSATGNAGIFDMAIPGTPEAGIVGCTFTNFMKPALTKPNEGGTLIFEIVFEAKEGVFGNIPLEFNAQANAGVQNAADSSAQPISFQLVNGSINIAAFTATFESDHGDPVASITKIDADNDGTADEAIVLHDYGTEKYDDHFTFAGWTDGTNNYAAGAEVYLEADTKFTAKWEEDPKATVTYEDEIATAPAAVTDYVGTEIDVAAPGTAPAGYEFLGWTDGENVYQAGDKLTIGENGVTLTAKWGAKVTLNVQGAKGEAPVIGGEIDETITLSEFGTGTLTKVNHTFLGWSETENGEIITEYTIKAGNNVLYAVWDEIVENAAVIETKVTYYTGTDSYLVDLYFYGEDANTVAFGYSYGENLSFVGFTPAQGLEVPHDSLAINEDGYYVATVAATSDGVIEGAAATAGNGVHLGTIAFTYIGEGDYSEDNEADNVAITAPKQPVDKVCSEEYFLFVPNEKVLGIERLPVVFDEAITVEIIDVVYPVIGSVEVVRQDGTAPGNFAQIKVVKAGLVIKTIAIEDADTTTTNGVFEYAIELPEGNYELVIDKTGYLEASVSVNVEAQEGAVEEGFEAEPIELGLTTLTPGDVVQDFGVIDLFDFAAIVSAFGRDELADEITAALDIDESGSVTVIDLNYIKEYYGEKA